LLEEAAMVVLQKKKLLGRLLRLSEESDIFFMAAVAIFRFFLWLITSSSKKKINILFMVTIVSQKKVVGRLLWKRYLRIRIKEKYFFKLMIERFTKIFKKIIVAATIFFFSFNKEKISCIVYSII
jgi:hypothetical protein